MTAPRRADTSDRSERSPVGLFIVIFLLVALGYLLSPVAIYGDGRAAGPTAASIVVEGDLDIDEYSDVAWFGGYRTTYVDGHAYDFFPWTRSIFAVPVAAALAVAETVGIGDGPAAAVRSDTWEPILLLVPGALTTAGAAALAGLLAWRQVADPRHRRKVAIIVALGAALATGYWSTASRGLWAHGPACLWFTAALLGAWGVEHGRRRGWSALLMGAAAGAAMFTRPPFVFPAIALAIWMVLRHRKELLGAAGGALAVAVPVVAVNLLTFGTLMMPYYDTARAGRARPDPLLYGIAATLVSPSRGVVFFMPAAVAAAGWGLVIAVRRRREVGLRIAVAVSMIPFFLFMATSPEGWWAGHAFGPRFVVDLVPFFAFLGVPAVEAVVSDGLRRPAAVVLALLAAWSIFVNAQGALIRESLCWNTVPADVDFRRSRVWDIGQAQFLVGARWIASGHSPLQDSCVNVALGRAGFVEVSPGASRKGPGQS